MDLSDIITAYHSSVPSDKVYLLSYLMQFPLDLSISNVTEKSVIPSYSANALYCFSFSRSEFLNTGKSWLVGEGTRKGRFFQSAVE